MTHEALHEIARAERARTQAIPSELRVCMSASCRSSNSDAVKSALLGEVAARGLGDRCRVKGVGCMGLCGQGPLVGAEPGQVLYRGATPGDAAAIVSGLGGEGVDRLKLVPGRFFERQQRVVLENSGRIDPERIEDAIAGGGYVALVDAVTTMTPAGVIEQITRSGLRGRGGAGYPTGLKWSTVAKARPGRKFVVCNGDEGDPGAFMDRSVLESDPHRVIEGLAIAAYAVGATEGFLYVRAEYPLAVARLREAIRQAERMGLLGHSICGTTFNLKLDVRLGGGAFVCGEETALLASLGGGRGIPRPRPPYPAESGLWGCPTLINNVETLAAIPGIVRRGGDWYAAMGTRKSRGTKVFALAGCVVNTGLIEVPMGMTLRDVVYEVGGGIRDGRAFKAVQTGGPSGGCLPESCLDLPIDYESLADAGSIIGSGGMIVMDDSACMVDVARYFMEFCMTESCGKCVPCRVGTVQLHGLLTRMTTGQATLQDLALVEELCDMVKHTSLCGLGQAAPNPLLSTLRHFRDEYVAHIVERRCPAGLCRFDAVEAHA